MGKVFFRNRINESISEQSLDDIVIECSPLYIEACRLGDSVTQKNYRNYVTDMQLKQRDRLLNKIVKKINAFYDDDVLFIDSDNYYDDLTFLKSNDIIFVNILTQALYSGITFTEAEQRYNERVDNIISNNRKAKIENDIRQYGKYDRAYYASGFGKIESPSKYSGITLDTPTVLGKIKLPKENEKYTQRRNRAVRGSQQFNEGFSYYDKTQWLPEKNFFENNFRVFCRKHDIIIENKQLYDLCELLYDGILKYSFDALRELKGENIEEHLSIAIYDIRTFIYNRDKTSEHYSEYPSKKELNRLRDALHKINYCAFGRYNFVYPANRALEMTYKL